MQPAGTDSERRRSRDYSSTSATRSWKHERQNTNLLPKYTHTHTHSLCDLLLSQHHVLNRVFFILYELIIMKYFSFYLFSEWRGIISITSAVWSTSRLSTRAVTFHALHVTLGRYRVCVCVCVCVCSMEYLKAQYKGRYFSRFTCYPWEISCVCVCVCVCV